MNDQGIPIRRTPWLAIVGWAALGGWVTWEQLAGYLRTAQASYLLSTAGWLGFTILQCVVTFVAESPARDRVTPRQLRLLRVAPFAALAVVVVGIVWRASVTL